MKDMFTRQSFIRGLAKAQRENEIKKGENKMKKTLYELRTELIGANFEMKIIDKSELQFTNTKRGAFTETRIKDHKYYDIYINEKNFMLHTSGRTTQQEIKELEKILGKKHLDLGKELTEKNLWLDWLELKK